MTDNRNLTDQAVPSEGFRNELRYMDVARRLREMIERGSLAVGTLLPSEQVLAEQFQVARATLRQAMAILAEEGLITRRRGAGTRVNDPQLWKRRMHATVGVVVREASLVHYGPEPQAGWNYRAWLFSLLCIELARRDLLVVPLLLPEQEALFKLLLLENRLHGVVGMPHVLDNYVGLLEERKVPVLLLETREHVPHADGVGISNRVAILQGMRELVRLGHRHIVYIGGLVGKSEGMPYRLAEDSAERFAAYREGITGSGYRVLSGMVLGSRLQPRRDGGDCSRLVGDGNIADGGGNVRRSVGILSDWGAGGGGIGNTRGNQRAGVWQHNARSPKRTTGHYRS